MKTFLSKNSNIFKPHALTNFFLKNTKLSLINTNNKAFLFNTLKAFSLFNSKPRKSANINKISSKSFSSNAEDDLSKLEREYKEYMKNSEKNFKLLIENIVELTNALNEKNPNTNKINNFINFINQVPIRLPVHDKSIETLANTIISKADRLSFNSTKELLNFLLLIEKLETDSLRKTLEIITENNISLISKCVDISDNCEFFYILVKYQIQNKDLWDHLIEFTYNFIDQLNAKQVTQALLGLSILKDGVYKVDSSLIDLVIKQLEKVVNNITYIDNFRLCMALSKKSFDLNLIPQKVWSKIQSNLVSNMTKFDLYQISNILITLCEYTHVEEKTFTIIEKDIVENYISKTLELIDKANNMDKLSKEEREQLEDLLKNINFESLINDIGLIACSFGINKVGSEYFWVKVFDFSIIMSKTLTIEAIENLLFSCYRVLLKDYGQNSSLPKKTYELLSVLEKKIIENELLEQNIINPFNAALAFTKIENFNQKLWNSISKNIYKFISNDKFAGDAFTLKDLVYIYSNYTVYLNNLPEKDKNGIYYLNNINKFWSKIDTLFGQADFFNPLIVSTIIVDLSQISGYVTTPIAWETLNNIVEGLLRSSFGEDIINKGEKKIKEADAENYITLDTHSYCLIVMGYSKYGFENLSEELYTNIKNYFIKFADKFSVEELRNICISFLRECKDQEFWKAYEKAFASSLLGNPKQPTLEIMRELQVPFAYIGLSNEMIWKKFAELAMRNLKLLETDNDFIMDCIFSFARSRVVGSTTFWKKVLDVLITRLSSYDLEDLVYIGMSLDSKYFVEFQPAYEVLFLNKEGKEFWNNYTKKVLKELKSNNNYGMDSVNISLFNNLVSLFTEYDHLKNKSESIEIRKISSNTLDGLLKSIKE